MRLHLRPEFLLRRSFRHAWIALQVQRRNRATAVAFRDPIVDGRGLPSSRSLIAAAAIAVALILFANHRYGKNFPKFEKPSLLSSSASMLPEVKSAPAPAPVKEEPPPAKQDAPAVVAPPSPEPEAAAPAPVASLPENAFALMACKRDRTLYVYKRAGAKWEKTAAFPMAIGRNAGPKSDPGDLRTPEGRYWITGVLPGPAKGRIYGSLVFTLNYPKPSDEAEGRSGQGIWIHGVEAGKLPTYTHGCLSLANVDVLALAAYAGAGTPVIILPDSLAPDPDKQMDLEGMEREFPALIAAHGMKTRADTLARENTLKQAREFVAKEAKDFPDLAMETLSESDKQAILDRIKKWRDDWCSREVDAYASNYDPEFRDHDGRDKNSFLERKQKIFASKSKIQMEVANPRIEAEGYARVKVSFRQDYLAQGPQGNQRSSGPKSLRLEAGPGGWLIVSE